jgi:hypothetical protein
MTKNVIAAASVTTVDDNHFDAATATLLDGNHQGDTAILPTLNDTTDWDSLRVNQDFATGTGQKTLTTIPVCKPNKQWFFTVHPAPEWQYPTFVLEDTIDRDSYLVDKSLWGELQDELTFKTIFACINRQGIFFFWPIRMPDPNGRKDEWSRTALEFARLGMGKWVRVMPNTNLGAYEVIEACAGLPAPIWPKYDFKKLQDIAFRERFIRDLNHPVLRRLRKGL